MWRHIVLTLGSSLQACLVEESIFGKSIRPPREMARVSVLLLAMLASFSTGVTVAQFEEDGERSLQCLSWLWLARIAGGNWQPCLCHAFFRVQALHGAALSIWINRVHLFTAG